jgi:hypothetical protein
MKVGKWCCGDAAIANKTRILMETFFWKKKERLKQSVSVLKIMLYKINPKSPFW